VAAATVGSNPAVAAATFISLSIIFNLNEALETTLSVYTQSKNF